MATPHVHEEAIIAWAKGAAIQCKWPNGEWKDTVSPGWFPNTQYRIKPRAFPKSSLGYSELCGIVNICLADEVIGEGIHTRIARKAADEAVKQYILDQEKTNEAL